jgi:hypothetical protein
MDDDVDNLCNDYEILTRKLTEKERLCKELHESSEKLNIALFYQLVKSQEQNSKENRDLTYSNIVLSYVAAIVALAALGNDIWCISGLPLVVLWIGTLVLLLGGMFWIKNKFKSQM